MSNIQNAFAISIRGASHIESGKPLQDYSIAIKTDDVSIAIVCDGHGADKHFRSEVGSKLAAIITEEVLLEFYESNKTYEVLNTQFAKKIDCLKLAILTRWQNKIEEYTKENPFKAEELSKSSSSFALRKQFDISQPYGTTLLAVLLAKDYYLALMIGDGAIIKITDNFTASSIKFSGKEEYNDAPHSLTDSLCGMNAFRKIFTCFEKIQENENLAFAVCSDGLSEAFINDQNLFAKINNYLNYYADEGLTNATNPIMEQLNEISRRSAMKDDISIAFAVNNIEKFASKNSNEAN